MSGPDISSPEPMQSGTIRNRPGTQGRWLIAGSAGILLLGGAIWGWRWLSTRQAGPMMGMPQAAPVKLEPAKTGLVQNSSEFLGTLEAQQGVVLQPEVSGRVTEVAVSAGDRVTEGQTIIVISPDRTQAEANAAAASVTAAESARQSASASLRSLLSRQSELEAELTLEQAEFDRTRRLVDQGAQSEQELDLARRDLEVAQAALDSARDEIAAARANLEQSEATLEQAQANESAAQQSLRDRTVTAPIAGRIGDLSVKLGDYVTPNSVITNITENATLELDLKVPIEERNRLSLGQPVKLLSSTDETEIADGSVTFISPQTDVNTQTVLIKATVNNPQGRLQDAQQVEARIIWSEATGVLIPTTAISRIGGETYVYVAKVPSGESPQNAPQEANADPCENAADFRLTTPTPAASDQPPLIACSIPVELGDIQDNQYVVLNGIQSGEPVVVSGILNLRNGVQIVQQAAENSPPTQ